jgi:hypothetical protein
MDIEGPPGGNIHLFDFIAAADGFRITGEMAHVVRGKDFINNVPVSFVALLEPEYDDIFILVSGYGFSLLSLKLRVNSVVFPKPAGEHGCHFGGRRRGDVEFRAWNWHGWNWRGRGHSSII